MNTACVATEFEPGQLNREIAIPIVQPHARTEQERVRWTTKQAITACLWSALIGLGCGYGWLLLQIGTCQ